MQQDPEKREHNTDDVPRPSKQLPASGGPATSESPGAPSPGKTGEFGRSREWDDRAAGSASPGTRRAETPNQPTLGVFTRSGEWDDEPAGHATAAPEREKQSKLQQLVEFIGDLFVLILDLTGKAWAVPVEGPRIAQSTSAFVRSVRAAWYHAHGEPVSRDLIATAWDVLVDEADDQDRVELPIRVGAGPDGTIYLDLGRARNGQVVAIKPGDWLVLDSGPLVFVRTQLTRALPVPKRATGERDDKLRLFREMLNVSDDEWPLVLAWMVASLIPGIAHPVLALIGEHGSAKTTAARLVTGVIDPSSAPSRSAPRDEHDWAVSAAQSYAIVLDNISRLVDWFSDALCRAVTDDSYVCRRLYTDDELTILRFRRVITFTAIHPGELHDDLADRLVVVRLARIDETARQEDEAIPTLFAQHHAEILKRS